MIRHSILPQRGVAIPITDLANSEAPSNCSLVITTGRQSASHPNRFQPRKIIITMVIIIIIIIIPKQTERTVCGS